MSGIRSFVRNNYDQAYQNDFTRIIQRKNDVVEDIFKNCLIYFYNYIKHISKFSIHRWEEIEKE